MDSDNEWKRLSFPELRIGGSSDIWAAEIALPRESWLDNVPPDDIFFSIVTDDPLFDKAAVQYDSRPLVVSLSSEDNG